MNALVLRQAQDLDESRGVPLIFCQLFCYLIFKDLRAPSELQVKQRKKTHKLPSLFVAHVWGALIILKADQNLILLAFL